MIGGTAEEYVALHRTVVDGAFETIGDGAALMACLEFHTHVLCGKFADDAALELLRLLTAAELAALLL